MSLRSNRAIGNVQVLPLYSFKCLVKVVFKDQIPSSSVCVQILLRDLFYSETAVRAGLKLFLYYFTYIFLIVLLHLPISNCMSYWICFYLPMGCFFS